MEIDYKQLKEAIKVLNDSGLLKKVEMTKIATVGVKKEKMAKTFMEAVEAVANSSLDDELDEVIVEQYNNLVGNDDEEGEEATEEDKNSDEEEEKEEEKEKKPKKKTTKAEGRSCYGHFKNAKSGQLDNLMRDGSTFGEIAEAVDVKVTRIKSHIKDLKDRGLTVQVVETENWKNNKVIVKEKQL